MVSILVGLIESWSVGFTLEDTSHRQRKSDYGHSVNIVTISIGTRALFGEIVLGQKAYYVICQ